MLAKVGLLVALAWILAGCNRTPNEDRLAGFERDYFDALFRARPTLASAEGLHQYDGRLDDYDPISIDRRIDELGRMLIRLRSVNAQDLTSAEAIDRQLIEARIRRELLLLGPSGRVRSSPSFYFELPAKTMERLARRPYATASKRLDAVIVSVNEVEAVLAAVRTNIGKTSRAQAESGIDLADGFHRFVDGDLRQWGRSAAGIDARLAQSFEVSLDLTVDSIKETQQWLREDLLPRSSAKYSADPRNLIMAVLFDSLVEMPLSELRELAGSMLESDYGALVEQADQVAPGSSPRAALANAAGDPPPVRQLRAELLKQARDLERFTRTRGLATLPEPDPEIKLEVLIDERWPSLRSPLQPFDVDIPPMGGGERRDPTSGYLVVSPPVDAWPAALQQEVWRQFGRANARLAAAALMVPGRYLQSIYAMRRPTQAQRMLQSRVTREGWGHYVEQMVVEAGLDDGDPVLKLIQLHRAVLRDCRFVASVGLHGGGMAPEEAARLFREKALLSPALAALEVRQTIVDPMRLAPALGKARILRLREDFRKARGPGYKVREFNDEFLKYGGMPVPLIRQAMLGHQ